MPLLSILLEFNRIVSRFFNKMDIFNEATILFLCYILWVFSDYNGEYKIKFGIGWVYCGIIAACLIFQYSSLNLYELVHTSLKMLAQKAQKFSKVQESKKN